MKTAVIYWSGTGNTEAMAKAVAEGAGAECFAVSEFSGNVEDYDAIALGCPAMGAEELEDSVLFTLKKDVFQEHFLSFLMEQTQIMHDFDAEEIKEEVEALKSRSLPDYMKWIKENRMPSCLWYGKCTIVSPLYCSEKLYMSADGVDYLVEGKAVLECYDSLFTYIHNMIRKTSANPLKDTVAVLLD